MSAGKRNVNASLLLAVAISALLESPEVRAYQISGPTLGYFADAATSTVRAINGIPGASAIGRPVRLDLKIRHAQFSVDGDYALGVTDSGDVVLLTDLAGITSVSPIPGAANGVALELSPNGTSAVVYSGHHSRIQVIGGLPSNPVVRWEADTASIGDGLTAIALSNSEQVLAAFSNGEAGTLYLFAQETAPRLISAVGRVSGIAVAPAGDRVVIADSVWNQVVLFEDFSTAAIPIHLAASVDGISNPAGVLVSRDAQKAYVANQGSGTVTIVNLAGGKARDVPCHCHPTTMRRLRGDPIFALTERTDEPIVLFDGESTDPRILIVPAEPQQPSDWTSDWIPIVLTRKSLR